MPPADRWLLADKHRRLQSQIAAGTWIDLRRIWGSLDPGNLDATFPRFATYASATVQARRTVSSALGASFYRTLRDAEGVAGAFSPVTAGRVAPEALETSLRVTGPVAWKAALARGADPAQAQATAFGSVQRAMTRHVLDGGRQTILQSSILDDNANGYQRVSDGKPCAFCAMLIGRGAVYLSEGTASFDAHDGCGCQPVPFWGRTPGETAQAQRYRELWEEHGAPHSGALARRSFRRGYEKAFRPTSLTQAASARAPLPANHVATLAGSIHKSDAAAVMYGRGSAEHLTAIKRFGAGSTRP